jgi:hypothetical protein
VPQNIGDTDRGTSNYSDFSIDSPTYPWTAAAGTGIWINAEGGSGGHAHGWTGAAMDFAVAYVDAIICVKD